MLSNDDVVDEVAENPGKDDAQDQLENFLDLVVVHCFQTPAQLNGQQIRAPRPLRA